MEVIKLKNVSKKFKIPHDRQIGLKGTVLNFLKGRGGYEEFYALKDINLSVNKGDFIGIIGRNGAGKSTLLKIIAKVLKPTAGKIYVKGKVSPFLELGLGFQGELSAKDNIYLYGSILGLKRKEIDKKFDNIIKFAELERFVDMKLKSFSSGMLARLGFSVAIQVDADIILIDEVLAVGDIEFQKKCFDYFERIKGKKTILFVSHDMHTIKKYCNKVLFLTNSLRLIDKTQQVVDLYQDLTKEYKHDEYLNYKKGDAEVRECWFEDLNGKIINKLDKEEIFYIKIKYLFHKRINNPIFGLIIKDKYGNILAQNNTKWAGIKTYEYKKNQDVTITFEVTNSFKRGEVYLSPAVALYDETNLDWKERFCSLRIVESFIKPRGGIFIKDVQKI